jgi:hypothetical protein
MRNSGTTRKIPSGSRSGLSAEAPAFGFLPVPLILARTRGLRRCAPFQERFPQGKSCPVHGTPPSNQTAQLPVRTRGRLKSGRGRCAGPRPGWRPSGLRPTLLVAQKAHLFVMPAHGGQYCRSRRPDPGGVSPTASQDCHLPRRLGVFHLAAPLAINVVLMQLRKKV